jgi:hypothetical protein
MRFGIKLVAVLTCMFLGGASSALAQQKGQYVPGQFGLNAGVIPDPGLTYANLALNYSASQLNGPNGNSIPGINGTYSFEWMKTFSTTFRNTSSSADISWVISR